MDFGIRVSGPVPQTPNPEPRKIIMATGIRFTISGSDTDFSVEEVGAISVQPIQSFKLMERQAIKPDLYFEGSTWKTFTVELVEYWKTTLAKITTVIEAEVEMTLYPYYAYSPGKSYSVILVPDNIIKIYRYGEREAWVSHQLTFLQSS